MKKFLLLFVLLAACQTPVVSEEVSVVPFQPADELVWQEISFEGLPFSTEIPDDWELIELENSYVLNGAFGGQLILGKDAIPVDLQTAFGPNVSTFNAGENVNAHCFEMFCYLSSKYVEAEDAYEYRIQLIDPTDIAREILEKIKFN
jgi:hypothetical protein